MDYVTIKAYESTRQYLRIIAAVTGEQMVQVLDRLCTAELARVADEANAAGRTIIFEGHTTKGKSHATRERIIIDHFQKPIGAAGDDTSNTGDDPARDAGDGGDVAGDDAV